MTTDARAGLVDDHEGDPDGKPGPRRNTDTTTQPEFRLLSPKWCLRDHAEQVALRVGKHNVLGPGGIGPVRHSLGPKRDKALNLCVEVRATIHPKVQMTRSAPHRMRTLEVTIIDWGDARIGPAMLDLGNITKPGTIAFASYLRTWERCTGVTADPWLTRVGFLWATAYVNTLYMAFAVAQGTHTGRGPRDGWAGLGSMIDRAETALGELERALDRQP